MVGVEDTFGIHYIYPEAKLASMDIISKKKCVTIPTRYNVKCAKKGSA